MSQDKKYQVFISSTFTDLINAREKATKVILDLYHLPVGMEMFSADDDDQWKIITDAIDVSDYYVLIIGHRYGSLTSKGISYTEKEFNYAKSKKIPIISFIRDRNVAISNSDRETVPESLIKLDKFIEKAKNGKMCAFWTDVSDLERQIAVALPKSFARHKGVGWVRGDTKSEHIAEEIAKLSEENRKLREENELLKKNSSTRKPQLKISLNGFCNDSETSDQLIRINFPILLENKKFKHPEKRKNTNLSEELRRFNTSISSFASIFSGKPPEDFYDDYNADIDAITDTQIYNHNLSLQFLEQFRKGRIQLDIQIENIGTLIASNVDIEIKFPDFIKVINDDDDDDIEYYQKEFSKNLIRIDTPEQRSEKSKRGLLETTPFLAHRDLNLSRYNDRPSKDFLKDNIIHIKLNSLLHSKNEILDNYYIFPIEKGCGVIEVQLICADYSHPESFEIPITVE